MTPQEIFTHVATHLLKQNARSENSATCQYRGSDGLMCAVGCLLTDEEYRPEMEGNTVDGLDLPERLLPHVDLLWDLQMVHDNHDVDSWRGKLEKLALKNNLSMPQV